MFNSPKTTICQYQGQLFYKYMYSIILKHKMLRWSWQAHENKTKTWGSDDEG